MSNYKAITGSSKIVHRNQGGGSKLQGIPSTTNLNTWAHVAFRNRNVVCPCNRNIIFCMNQLGGVGAGGIPGRSYAFAPSSDGTHKQFYCGHRFLDNKYLILQKSIELNVYEEESNIDLVDQRNTHFQERSNNHIGMIRRPKILKLKTMTLKPFHRIVPQGPDGGSNLWKSKGLLFLPLSQPSLLKAGGTYYFYLPYIGTSNELVLKKNTTYAVRVLNTVYIFTFISYDTNTDNSILLKSIITSPITEVNKIFHNSIYIVVK